MKRMVNQVVKNKKHMILHFSFLAFLIVFVCSCMFFTGKEEMVYKMITRQGRKMGNHGHGGEGAPLFLESILAAQRTFQSPPPPPMARRTSHN